MKLLNQPIEMICVNGKEKDSVKPIRFRVEENEELKVVKIKKIMTKGKVKVAGRELLTFTCMVDIGDIEKICEVRFDKISTTWYLYKI